MAASPIVAYEPHTITVANHTTTAALGVGDETAHAALRTLTVYAIALRHGTLEAAVNVAGSLAFTKAAFHSSFTEFYISKSC